MLMSSSVVDIFAASFRVDVCNKWKTIVNCKQLYAARKLSVRSLVFRSFPKW